MRLLHFVTLLVGVTAVSAFISPYSTAAFPSTGCGIRSPFASGNNAFLPRSVQNQRKSVANVQTAGLFGLGLPEIAIILVAGLLVLGPEKISEMVRASGQVAGELKNELRDVPEEFKKGLEEGETNARSSKAKKMEPVPDDE
jgi:sec-independent protein translocase protein TatA